MEEIWKWVAEPLYNTRYQVSSLGRVRRYRPSAETRKRPYEVYKILKQHKHKDHGDYLHVTLSIHNRLKTISVHTLVIEAFVGPPPPNMVCSHKDDIPDHNHLDNLEYKTQRDNLLNSTKWRPENLWLRVSEPRK